jgi:hypothetical protein
MKIISYNSESDEALKRVTKTGKVVYYCVRAIFVMFEKAERWRSYGKRMEFPEHKIRAIFVTFDKAESWRSHGKRMEFPELETWHMQKLQFVLQNAIGFLRRKNRKHPRETVDDHLRFQTKKELLRQTNLVPVGTTARRDAKVPVVNLVEMKPPIPLRPPLQKNPSFKTTKNSSISGKEGQSNKSSSFFVPNTSEETGEVR